MAVSAEIQETYQKNTCEEDHGHKEEKPNIVSIKILPRFSDNLILVDGFTCKHPDDFSQ